MIWNSYPKPYVVFIAKPSTYVTCYLIELYQIVVTLSEIHLILPWSRSHTCFYHMLYFYTRSKQISIHPQNKTPSSCMARVYKTGRNRSGSGVGRYQTGPNSKFKFELKKWKFPKKFLKILQGVTNLMVSNFLKNLFN